ncbi:MAG: UDP-N-acetylmuramate dehydrogenase [bacterium]|nr:UDP-N-acetylmuramate dehydrogenase [bacterium]
MDEIENPQSSFEAENAELALFEQRPLAPLTTLELGGAAEFYLEANTNDELEDAVAWARSEGHPVTILGGGSNVVVADTGVSGLVMHMATRGFEVHRDGDSVDLTVAAGEPWDEVVERCVDENWAGIECLSGIPGLAGATPIQNVGAYGQEVAQTIVGVRALNLRTQEIVELSREDCGFGYRSSVFRERPGRFALVSVCFRLCAGGTPILNYRELKSRVGEGASLLEVREAVLDLRRSKSMVIDSEDPNRRSVGSFFTNPILIPDDVKRLKERALALGCIDTPSDVPVHDLDDGRCKVSAAWLIEKTGVARGLRNGAVGVSSHHALALVHHGNGSTQELIALAREIRNRVRERFAVILKPEPVFLGFQNPNPLST